MTFARSSDSKVFNSVCAQMIVSGITAREPGWSHSGASRSSNSILKASALHNGPTLSSPSKSGVQLLGGFGPGTAPSGYAYVGTPSTSVTDGRLFRPWPGCPGSRKGAGCTGSISPLAEVPVPKIWSRGRVGLLCSEDATCGLERTRFCWCLNCSPLKAKPP